LRLSIIDLFRSAFRQRDARYRQQLSIFLICLIISILIWFTLKLSGDFQAVIPVTVRFTNLPKNKSLTEKTDTTLLVKIQERGTELLRIKFLKPNRMAEVSLRNIKLLKDNNRYRGYVLSSSLISQVEYALGLTGRIESIFPDTLFVLMEERASRKLPVTADIALTYSPQFMLYGDIVYEPDSIVVAGPAGMIGQLDRISLGALHLSDISQTVTIHRPVLRDPSLSWVIYNPAEVNVTIPVEKFTEASIELPVTLMSDTTGVSFRTFPETVKVTYNVALKDFNNITREMFDAVAFLRNTDLTTSNGTIKVRLNRQPPLVRVTRVEPDKVEFIILH